MTPSVFVIAEFCTFVAGQLRSLAKYSPWFHSADSDDLRRYDPERDLLSC